MNIYKQNVERWMTFLESEYYKELAVKRAPEINWIIDSLYLDADQYDKELYQELGNKYNLSFKSNHLETLVNGTKIQLSSDIICGYKQILNFHKGDFKAFIDDYISIRSNLSMHFIWPKHKAPTINTLRYSKYKDRIDLLLYDIKEYYDSNVTPMSNAYSVLQTRIWLEHFIDFKNFIVRMKLNRFVDHDYNVLDISRKNSGIIDHVFDIKEVNNSIEDYMSSLISLIHSGCYQ